MRQVLLTHAIHPLLDEELREFLEPGDTDIPTEFLGNSVREVLETPFVRLARRWVGRGCVRCLLNLLGRAVASIRSLTGAPDDDPTIADVTLRQRTISVTMEIARVYAAVSSSQFWIGPFPTPLKKTHLPCTESKPFLVVSSSTRANAKRSSISRRD